MTSPERVAIVGTGLLGTSIGLAALRAGDEVRGVDIDPTNAAIAAGRLGAPVEAVAETVLAWASLIVVATPVGAVADAVVAALAAAPAALVTDVASVKGPVVDSVRARVADASMVARFVPGHPMAGTERTGPASAAAGLLDGATWVLTPDDATPHPLLARLEGWIRGLGSHPVQLPAGRHDRLVATVSHLPQLASTALMDVAVRREAGEPDALVLAAGGFRDLTRLAASNPRLWAEILTANREEVVAAIDAFVGGLTAIRDLVAEGAEADVEAAFARAKAARLSLATRARVRSGVAVLLVPIPDRPGALAAITAALGDVNIEDLQIVHSSEGGGGMVHLTVTSESLDGATSALAAAGHAALRLA
ncbi:MAG: prephenate dehydrogenase/arogenate dehydrogenase family protein [Actinomycetota bacterium]